jgi:hypothetical protein
MDMQAKCSLDFGVSCLVSWIPYYILFFILSWSFAEDAHFACNTVSTIVYCSYSPNIHTPLARPL